VHFAHGGGSLWQVHSDVAAVPSGAGAATPTRSGGQWHGGSCCSESVTNLYLVPVGTLQIAEPSNVNNADSAAMMAGSASCRHRRGRSSLALMIYPEGRRPGQRCRNLVELDLGPENDDGAAGGPGGRGSTGPGFLP
jgi:hypothetical protein